MSTPSGAQENVTVNQPSSTPNHNREAKRSPEPYMVSEASLMPWIEAEAGRLRVPSVEISIPNPDAQREAPDVTAAIVRAAWAAHRSLVEWRDPSTPIYNEAFFGTALPLEVVA